MLAFYKNLSIKKQRVDGSSFTINPHPFIMKHKTKVKLILKDEVKNNPNNYKPKEVPVVVNLNYSFIKTMIIISDILILEKLNVSYYTYMSLMAKVIDDESFIDFNKFCETYKISKKNLNNRIKPKLKQSWIIKKWPEKKKYYFNPAIAVKTADINPDLISLFKKENKEIYWFEFQKDKLKYYEKQL